MERDRIRDLVYFGFETRPQPGGNSRQIIKFGQRFFNEMALLKHRQVCLHSLATLAGGYCAVIPPNCSVLDHWTTLGLKRDSREQRFRVGIKPSPQSFCEVVQVKGCKFLVKQDNGAHVREV
ncbi:hypothetical protein D3C81_975980 [compost metagenome]